MSSTPPDLESYPCVCGETAFTARRITARDPFTDHAFTYGACRGCGLERMVMRPRMADIGLYYPTDYSCYVPPKPRTPSMTDRIKALVYRTYYDPAHRGSALMRAALWPVRRRSVMAFRQPATRAVFEFGAGIGADLATFKEAGWAVSGCEPSPLACEAAASQGITLQNCLAEEAVLPEGTSCVFMNNVFEHLYDPALILGRIRDALTDDGVVVIIVPNHGSYTSRIFGAAWPGYDAPRHIWGWTPHSITRLLNACGFSVDYINQQAPVSLWGATLEGRNATAPPPRLLQWMARTRLARDAFVPLGWTAAAMGHGDYIRAVARKA